LKRDWLDLAKYALFVVLQRDVGEGRVTDGPGDTVNIDYELHPSDKKSIMVALKGLIQVLIASGAKRVATLHNDDHGCTFKTSHILSELSPRERVAQKEVSEYLSFVEKRLVLDRHKSFCVSAHQMGTCRFGCMPEQSACDQNGELWECDDVYVLDSSTFPTSIGSNPMVAVLTISHMLSRRIVKRMKLEDGMPVDGNINEQVLELMEARWQRLKSSSKTRRPPYLVPVAVLLTAIIVAFFRR